MGRWWMVGLALLAAGCGGNVSPVSGRVTLDGNPLPNASVIFQPTGSDAGSGSYGKTDADGRYTLRLVSNDKAGAVVGKHRVSITLATEGKEFDGGARAGKRGGLLPKYNSETTLTFDVPRGGSDKADFPLLSR